MATTKKVLTKRDKLKLNYKDIGVRAAKTFGQSFVASVGIVFTATNLEDGKTALVSVLVSSLAAGLSVVQNAVLVIRDR